MKINIFGSTGQIGRKSLKLLKKYFPSISINLLVANNNYKLLISQTLLYKPKIICIRNKKFINFIKKNLKNKIKVKILDHEELLSYLNQSKTELSILAISGNDALPYLKSIFNNTKNLGLVNKESIISCGHLFKKINKNKTNLFPLDSEHYSIYNLLDSLKKFEFSKIKITASGGPFLFKSIKEIRNAKLRDVINHPKWKMGFKNSIDSATLVNKCLEVIEAHYLFDISFDKIDILIHPEALIHSIIEMKNNTSILNYFYNDMAIPIYNFLNNFLNKKQKNEITFPSISNNQLNFSKVDMKKFPIYNIFQKIDKTNPSNLIKFNLANQIAVNLYMQNKIKFHEIAFFIDKSLQIDFNFSYNSINSVIEFQNEYKRLIVAKYD